MSQMQIGERTFSVGCMRDISGRKAYTEALEHRTRHDDLTGLPNRALFGDVMDRAIASADRADETAGVLLVDLDDFRKVNETLGREQADVVLQAVAGRLRGTLRDADTVARLGGDAFGILPSGATDVDTAADVAWKVRKAFDAPFHVSGHVVDVRASIGIAFFPQHGRSTSELLRRADLAMHQAKRSGTGFAVFVAEPEDQTARRLAILSDLRNGIPRDELVLHFQPQGRSRHAPHHRGRGAGPLESPDPRAADAGAVHPGGRAQRADRGVDDMGARRGAAAAALWRDAGLDLTMAMNISARSLTPGSDLPDIVARLTETWGTASGTLVLELTENAIIDDDAPAVLERLHAMGERVAIDDFGTGHSSLVYLQRLPIDQLKMDRSFVLSLATVSGDAVIVRSTIDLAHNLGLTVVAEGVEDKVALDMLIEYGCDSAQGFWFSRPCTAEELTAWLIESPFGAPESATGDRALTSPGG